MIANMSHADYLAAEGISRSFLADLLVLPPAEARRMASTPSPPTPAMEFGTAFHTLALDGQAVFHRQYMDGTANSRVINGRNLELLEGMKKSLFRHKAAIELLRDSLKEVSVFWEEMLGIKCKARFDILCENHKIIADVKTASSVTTDAIRHSIRRYNYDLQAAHYLAAAQGNANRFVLIFVQKSTPFTVRCIELGEAIIRSGQEKRERALAILGGCIEKNDWPNYPNSIELLEEI